MIKKILSINNLGTFDKFETAGDLILAPLTIIYSENGKGKSTLSSLLRSLKGEKVYSIEERKTLGGSGSVRAELLVSINGKETKLNYNKGSWNAQLKNLAVFDEEFIIDNVHSGMKVEHEQKKNLYQFAVGAEAVNLLSDLDNCEKEIETLLKESRKYKEIISEHILDNMPFDEFVALPYVDDLDTLIEAAEKRLKDAELADLANKTAIYKILPTPSLTPDSIGSLLNKSLQTESQHLDDLVRSHLHTIGSKAEKWLAEGVGYVAGSTCPFCAQDISDSELVSALKNVFSATYKQFVLSIEAELNEILAAYSPESFRFIEVAIDLNIRVEPFWVERLKTTPLEFDLTKLKSGFQEASTAIKALCDRKRAHICDAINAPDLMQLYVPFAENVKRDIMWYNLAVLAINEAIEQYKNEMGNSNVDRCKADYSRWRNVKVRNSDKVYNMCEEYKRNGEIKKVCDERKKELKNSLELKVKDTVARYQDGMNKYLEQFGAAFRVSTQQGYVARSNVLGFDVVIKNRSVPSTGGARLNDPTFKTVLSTGDRSALAFAFFLAGLTEDKKDEENRLLIIDDPISSLDDFRKTATHQVITRIGNKSKQVIILSHDPGFLYDLWSNTTIKEKKAYCIKGTAEGSKLAKWDIKDAVRSSYSRNYITLAEYLNSHEDCEPAKLESLGRMLRPMLETYVKFNYPMVSLEGLWLGSIIKEIKNAADSSPLSKMKPKIEEMESINEYTKEMHHGSEHIYAVGTISNSELRSYINRCFRIMEI